ncbi:hypothetical protein HY992_00100 [Candidatus Micrarchaeota archaeon]|nr:hypothetical protein [Candidatus Micrarchaeota archaeon]
MNARIVFLLFAFVLLFNASTDSAADDSADSDVPQIVTKLGEICKNFVAIVPIVALLMFIVAGAIYAAGQIMGAETRARANVWSTAMLVGGIIGLILAASAPYFITTFAKFALGTSTGTYEIGSDVDQALRVCSLGGISV